MKNVYFIGIGGIGMSAIARYYNLSGYNISGYDKTPSNITDKLSSEGIKIHFDEDINLIPKDVKNTLCIYTPAIPKDMKELIYIQERPYTLVKRSKALGIIAKDKDCIGIAGTHGKTTISTLVSHIFTDSLKGCSAFLGGISKNYHSNLLVSNNNFLVAEADEFDRSFLQLFPKTALITSIDADHLDIYKNAENLKKAFHDFAAQVKKTLILKKKIATEEFKKGLSAKIYTYAFDEKADFYASDLKYTKTGCLNFTLNTPESSIQNVQVGVPGWVNVENAIAASAVSYLEGISLENIKTALANFQGVERRFDIQINTPHLIYIDDYAHHPNELSATISSVRNMFPHRHITAIFQPHLYSRTRDFCDDFAKSLSALDRVILLPIYPARELPIEGVSSEIILNKIKCNDKKIIKKENILKELDKNNIDIVLTFGAGDIGLLVPKIKNYLCGKKS
ncbi:MAG: UDP-N-acetylmuramate--L-alanine ligase [Bacteroidales bacterium]